MRQLGVQVSMYNQHRNGKYSSYRGTVGKIAQNVLQQSFTATKPYQVIHTDITQIWLANQQVDSPKFYKLCNCKHIETMPINIDIPVIWSTTEKLDKVK